ncbi:MAG: hypothetical protein FWC09_00520 [Lachnospiraceae bacterium]|nr:hypothetical protein [Lachnospiraceae bacterium]
MEPGKVADAMIDDIVNMLDEGFKDGVGHVNVEVNENEREIKNVETLGCTDCAKTPLACSIPTMLND